ncbi:hypothetical protein GCM10027059_27550 [Myceligenerans halotolerans]
MSDEHHHEPAPDRDGTAETEPREETAAEAPAAEHPEPRSGDREPLGPPAPEGPEPDDAEPDDAEASALPDDSPGQPEGGLPAAGAAQTGAAPEPAPERTEETKPGTDPAEAAAPREDGTGTAPIPEPATAPIALRGGDDTRTGGAEAPRNENRDTTAIVDDAVPDAAVPDAAVPDAAVPDDAVPDTAVPSAAVPSSSRGADAPGNGDGDPGDARPVRARGPRRLWEVFRPRNRRAEYIAAALCVAFGFALAVQVAQSTGDQLASLRQDELVRLLDEVTQRGEQLDDEVANLTEARDDLLSADGQDRAARELAEQRAEYEGILSGRLPAQGPGVLVEIHARPGTVTAANMFNMLEELRNAGVEAQQVNDVRIVTSSHFEETVDEDARILLDGHLLEAPYTWVAIGDPETVDRALEIPGGALPTLRDAGATAEVTRQEHVVVDATRTPADPEHAEPSEE